MIATKVNAKIVEDNSGISTEIPVILTDQGVLQPVVDYVLFLQLQGTSLSTLNKHIQSIILLIDFLAANEGMFKDPSNMFEVFVRRLYSGTILVLENSSCSGVSKPRNINIGKRLLLI
jgi:hypothetical protein